jgi:hypothetical protein
MSLTSLWETSPEQLNTKHVQQVIAFSGTGHLRDESEASLEFRTFLGQVPSEVLSRYADECLNTKFDDGGLALQDVVNQIGRRLGFSVEDGRYRGTPHALGFDGLWRSASGHAIVAEVKTTDAYRIDLNTIAEYRRDLVRAGRIAEDASSILIIVGRQDTGDLEAQIRGSRHAWDIRLISVDSLLRLVAVKEEVEDPKTARQIGDILVPREYTRVDGIIDLVFATATEVIEDDKPGEKADTDNIEGIQKRKPKFVPVSFNQACADRIQKHLGVTFIRRSKATFATPDNSSVVVCSVSKAHGEEESTRYWFAFHPHQAETLSQAANPFVAYGCGSAETVILIPFAEFKSWLPGLNMTKLEDREYWHIHISRDPLHLTLDRKAGYEPIDLTPYLISTAMERSVNMRPTGN